MEDIREQSPHPCVSDSESGVSGGRSDSHFPPELFVSGRESILIRLGEEERAYRGIKQRLVSSLGLQPPADVVAVYRRNLSVSSAQANSLAFQVYLRALSTKNSGDVNVKYAWYGASKDGIGKIISHGFGHEQINRTSDALYGRGVYLSPDNSPLARVLLGKVEAIQPGSDQTHPSSDEFDSGVDSVVSPKSYIVWSTNMNTHILPEFIVSFRAAIDSTATPPIPRSPWMSFPALLTALSGLLNPHVMSSVKQHYTDFAEKRISRDELVRSIRRVAGDELLASVIKSCSAKA
ncbi:hypothetical protein V2J09_006799 [Rumex salicifolius]